MKSATCKLKYAITSYKKMELIAKMIRGKKAADAINVLHFVPKKAAQIMYKVVKSAMHNAHHNDGADINNLIISEVQIGRGPKIKRMRFASRSRMHAYVKHRSYVQVTVTEAQ